MTQFGPASRGRTCAYCGDVLDPRYYFCVRCASAHRMPDSGVYGEAPPVQTSLEKKLSGEGRVAFDFVCVLAIGLAVSGGVMLAVKEKDIATTLLVVDAVVAALTIGFAMARRREIGRLFGPPRRWSVLLPAAPLLGALIAANVGYHSLLARVFELDREADLFAKAASSMHPAVAVLSLCAAPGVFEEIGFRGIVQTRLVSVLGTRAGWALTSVLFVALHLNVLSSPYLFLVSLYLCWLRERTQSLYPSMAAHFLHNLAVLGLTYDAIGR